MNLKEKAYDVIKERILNGVYPPGQMLNEKEIIEELSISRTPFREAINALCKESLINIFPRRGMFVAEITVKDVADIYSIRKVLEPFAVRLAFENIPKEVLLDLKEKMQDFNEKSYDQIVREDEDLHSILLRYADNAYLSRMMENLYEHNKRVRVLSTRSAEDVKITIQQHQIILEAMLDGDVDKAAQEMEKHIESSRERAFRHIFTNNSVIIR
ncbi:GntR family transcriptional regulator [Christensenella tenuis]|jgi:GntR family transcriptional regulator, rspAB operon transcriptional repressor|uniref:GntR family transcriptional regulator n=1 Tax=Christensenella tenuis TaxID=2763033 RepID=A0ABR7EEK9_9FIRM|nr:GntR family transcriptional regulator [Christensenella tenuis]MBC5648220.1 GntR family transcriptional regulator [Christensenella tenuis]